MDFHQACEILDLPKDSSAFTLKELKYNYRIKALKYHPDKNTNPEAHDRFIEISEAYNYLIQYLKVSKDETYSNETHDYSNGYVYILTQFLKNITENDNITYDSIEKIIQSISKKTYKASLVLFEEFDKHTALKLYGYLFKYKDIFHIKDSTLCEIEQIIREKVKNDNIIIINPTIENLLNKEIYKLEYKNELYYIPLWHNEISYDISNTTLIVKCVPILPNNMYTDQYNNLHVNISILKTSLFEKKYITTIINSEEYKIPVSKLYIKKNQIYIFGQCGIPSISQEDIYDISNLGSVIFHIDIA